MKTDENIKKEKQGNQEYQRKQEKKGGGIKDGQRKNLLFFSPGEKHL